jgi:cystathionine beta-lyase
MMGAVTVHEKHFLTFYESFRYMGVTAAANTCYLVQRGLRTAAVRMERCFKSALEMATWLEKRPEVKKVFYPALPSNESYKLWKRDFTGAAGIFTIALDRKYSDKELAQMLDGLHLYSMGYSWGGYESLILPVDASGIRTATKWNYGDVTCIRFSIGLEDVEDLKEDLAEGFERLKK